VFYVLLWVGLVALSLVFGPVWRAISLVRTVHRLLRHRSLGLRYPDRAGYWPPRPACLHSSGASSPARTGDLLARSRSGCSFYLAVTMAGALCCGERWCARADPFEVYSVVASRLSPLRRNRDGRIAIGNPFDHLPTLPVRAGSLAVIAAHDKALRLLPAGHQLTGQLAMMLVMVGYTFTGLYLLFGG
jgi:hypothetical protein